MTLIGQGCKHSNVCSWLILISRGLDLQFVEYAGSFLATLILHPLHDVRFSRRIAYPPLAQLVEQLTLNQWVPGSNPWRRTIWPVGQAVKTAASHAANMGSIPVRVTTRKQAMDRSLPCKHESSLPPLFSRFKFQTLRWFEIWVSETKRKKLSWYWLGRGSTRSHSEHGS